MTGLLRTAYLVVFPHGGQRRARRNALVALHQARASVAEATSAAAAFAPTRQAI